MKFGLTGGIACGKSTVSAMLVERGAKLVDADQFAREVVLPGEAALHAIVAAFGQAILNDDGTLNRSELGSLVFGNAERLKQLEDILHPAIRTRMWERMNAYEQDNPSQLIIADIPLLYETGQASLYDGIIVVYVPRAVQIQRLMTRNSMTTEQAETRIALQMDIEEKKRLADYVIDNSGTLEQTSVQVERFWREQGLV
ncbi:dephospho-CoA kinase [Paenibacillus baekrokdamisoli]|uniref:Dephospho-CoA kinase n=1 Tax=Paenibacillus baekrokdamisoli TaxID=1712516 RepID=A0A3G9J7L8_9BACL|nr:dephospho-CoA kinase [Paenibacillus baekrokdamisoli]MBB3072685.1 dephospho-CoA kinase [Paenibacillus baekrokdamisoli]BBH18969.1 dephospho-CoA kinase [Paenibacillus baekrokdamisoli]